MKRFPERFGILVKEHRLADDCRLREYLGRLQRRFSLVSATIGNVSAYSDAASMARLNGFGVRFYRSGVDSGACLPLAAVLKRLHCRSGADV